MISTRGFIGRMGSLSASPRALGGSSRRHQAGVHAASGDNPTLVSPQWLLPRLDEVKVLDATWYMPNAGKSGLAEFLVSRIPGAQFFDLDEIADKSSGLPHMLPSEAGFAAAADALGISAADQLVIYDRQGLFSSPRAWWTWRVFGHERVAVLDGGLPGWLAASGPLDETPVAEEVARAPGKAASGAAQGGRYPARLRAELVRCWRELLSNVDSHREQVIDARPAARWRGQAPEPRAGLRSGRIPGSLNVPWDAVQEGGKLKSPEELRAVFEAAGVDLLPGGRPLVTTCGSGTTACVLALALAQLAPPRQAAIYDGSWSEWGGLPDVPVEADPP